MEAVQAELKRVAQDVQALLVAHTATATKVDALTLTLAEMRPDLKQIPNFHQRITLLERIVLGCCGIILAAILVMLLKGTARVESAEVAAPTVGTVQER